MKSEYIHVCLLITRTALKLLKHSANADSFIHAQELQDQPYSYVAEE